VQLGTQGGVALAGQNLPFTTVKSNFPQTLAYREYGGDGFATLIDGTYRDNAIGLDADIARRQASINQVFAPQDVIPFMRADREQNQNYLMREYFAERTAERRENDENMLSKMGLSTDEIATVMSERKMAMASKAMDALASRTSMMLRPPELVLRKEDLIAEKFADNDIPLISANDVRGAGNLQPRAVGHENYTGGFVKDESFRPTPRGKMTVRIRRSTADDPSAVPLVSMRSEGEEESQDPRRMRGRPPGSKNKPKVPEILPMPQGKEKAMADLRAKLQTARAKSVMAKGGAGGP
jgi:hypothetical protein